VVTLALNQRGDSGK